MSMLGSNSNMKPAPTFHDFKKQASFFLKEKIKTARLALTDVTPAQLLVEEATNGDPGGPDARTLKMISKAAFEVDDYWRIVGVLRKRLEGFDKRNWRESYKALIVLEYLLTHGPESVSQEFQKERDVITAMDKFRHIDEKGFNWGFNVRKKCERILRLLEKGPLLKEEREKARKISRGIQGFGSFSLRITSSTQEISQESSLKTFERCNSQFNDRSTQDEVSFASKEDDLVIMKTMEPLPIMKDSSTQSSRTRLNIEQDVIMAVLHVVVTGLVKLCKTVAGVRAPPPAFVFFSIFFIWATYMNVIRGVISSLLDIAMNVEIIMVFIGLCVFCYWTLAL